MGKTYRIKDIAELSGVSTGTVDRILHNRGKVSEEAQKKVEAAYRDREGWDKIALLNTASAGKFSSDRTIQQYVDEIWHLDKVTIEE